MNDDVDARAELAALWAWLEEHFPAIAQQARVALGRRPGPS